jgi:hypothetical protein
MIISTPSSASGSKRPKYQTMTGLSLDTRTMTLARNMMCDLPQCLLISPLQREMSDITQLIQTRASIREKSRSRVLSGSDLAHYKEEERQCSQKRAPHLQAALKAYAKWVVELVSDFQVCSPAAFTYDTVDILTDTYLRQEGAQGLACPPISQHSANSPLI